MAEDFDPTQYGAVIVDEPFDPTKHGAIPVEPKHEGGVISGIVAGLGRALNPINLVKGALDIGHPSDISNIIQYGKTLGEIVTGTSPDEAIGKNIPELQQQREAVYGKLGAKEQAATLTGIGLQLGMTALPFLHGETLPRAPGSLAEVAGIAKPEAPVGPVATDAVTPTEVAPIAPEVAQPVSAAESVATAPLSTETTTGGPDAVQIESTAGLLSRPQETVTETGSERVGVGQGVQGQEPTETGQAVAPQEQVAPEWKISGRTGKTASSWETEGASIAIESRKKGAGTGGKRYVATVGDEQYGALDLDSAKAWVESKLQKPAPVPEGEIGATAAIKPKETATGAAGTGEGQQLFHGSEDQVPFSRQNTHGYWFSNSSDAAAEFGNVTRHAVDVGKQADLNDPATLNELIKDLPEPKDAAYTKQELISDPDNGLTDWAWQNSILKEAERKGYDSATFVDETLINPRNPIMHNATIVFDKARIKPSPVSEPTETTTAQPLPKETAVPPTKPPPTPAETVTPPKPPAASGVHAAALEERPINAPPPGEVVGWEANTEQGHDWLDKGGDPQTIINKFAETKAVTPDDMGRMRAALQRLQAGTDAAGDALRKDPENPELQTAYNVANDAEQRFTDAFKPMHTFASANLGSLKGKIPFDEGAAKSFTGMHREFQANMGREFTPEEAVKADKLVQKNTEAAQQFQASNDELFKTIDKELEKVPSKVRGRAPTIKELGEMFSEKLREVCDV